MLISRKPYCNNCENRGSAWGPHDYQNYPCSKGEEINKKRPGVLHYDKSEDMYFIGEKMRCPCKEFFVPIYTKEQQLKHNHHK